jgi:predicted nucleotidyltransferase
MEKLDRNFADFLKLLNSHRVEYLVIGGFAVGYHGFVRATGDLDVFVGISPQNAAALVSVFTDFGFAPPEVRPNLFLEAGKIVRVGMPPIRIEILNSISGISFAEAYPKRIEEIIGGIRVPFIDRESLLRNKAASGRMRDLADIEGLTQEGGTRRQPRRP